MGGWYIGNDFLLLSYFSIPIACLYLYINWILVKFLMDTKSFPFGSYMFVIIPKATSFIFWKYIFYVLVISLLVDLLFFRKLGTHALRF